jgi:hypothetical protein
MAHPKRKISKRDVISVELTKMQLLTTLQHAQQLVNHTFSTTLIGMKENCTTKVELLLKKKLLLSSSSFLIFE